MRRPYIWIMLCLMALITVGCFPSFQTVVTPKPEPQVPEQLRRLPKTAWIKCSDLDRTKGVRCSVWEYPGLPPDDPDSGYMGKRGRLMGEVAACAEVQALQYAWSETDGVFWVLVTTDGVRGWITMDLLTFSR